MKSVFITRALSNIFRIHFFLQVPFSADYTSLSTEAIKLWIFWLWRIGRMSTALLSLDFFHSPLGLTRRPYCYKYTFTRLFTRYIDIFCNDVFTFVDINRMPSPIKGVLYLRVFENCTWTWDWLRLPKKVAVSRRNTSALILLLKGKTGQTTASSSLVLQEL